MNYPFVHDETIEGMCVAQYEGIATILGNSEDWHIGSIVLDGRDMKNLDRPRVSVELPQTHRLFTKISLMLHLEHKVEIGWRWQRRGQEEAA